ncbi:MAG: YidC/Oxa1 family membrane protein insertase [Candidatus Nanosyncoccaceae bacterium]
MFGILDALIVRPLVNIMFLIYNLVGDFGLAIIIFTILVKFAVWPLMKRQLHQTRVMREIQPELVEIKKNCNGNKQLESLQMMDLYKRKNIKPMRSMLMLFIQLPIFIALFTAINVTVRPIINEENRSKDYTVEHSAYKITEDLPRIKELIEHQNQYLEARKTDENAVYNFQPKLFGVVDLSAKAGFNSIDSIIILVFALTSAFTQFIMSRQQDPTRQNGKKRKTMRQLMKEAADGKEPSQEEINAVSQSTMSFTMPLMMLFIMIGLPGAVVFYYLLSNVITIIQQKVILSRNYEEMELKAEKKVLKELRDAKEAIVVKDETIAKDEAKIARLKAKERKSHYASSNKNKKSKEHITRISVDSNKKKRR